MSITNAGQFVRHDTKLRVAACFLVPATLLIAHFSHGADTMAASAWVGVLACCGLGCIIMMRPHTDSPPLTLFLFGLLALFVALGWTGNWHQARTEVMQLAIAIVFWTSGAMIGRSRQMLMTSWTVLSGSFAFIAGLALLSYPMMSAELATGTGADRYFRLSFSFHSPKRWCGLWFRRGPFKSGSCLGN